MTVDEGKGPQNDITACGAWLSIRQLAEGSEKLDEMVGGPTSSKRLFSSIRRTAPYKSHVLVEGESGTGKELVAMAMHRLGPFPNGPFVSFNCPNVVDAFADYQLFGHTRELSAAAEESQGCFRAAHRGTLFLDEVGELPLRLQPKLLHALESREVQAIGSARTASVDVRVVAATNHDLKAMVKVGAFRPDLYYRLKAVSIQLPRLRECRDAIPGLVAKFVQNRNEVLGRTVKYISAEAFDLLRRYTWPGNVRELSNIVESAMLMASGTHLGIDDFPAERLESERSGGTELTTSRFAQWPQASRTLSFLPALSLKSVIERARKEALARALRGSSGDCAAAAKLLRISKYTVYRMMNRYGYKKG